MKRPVGISQFSSQHNAGPQVHPAEQRRCELRIQPKWPCRKFGKLFCDCAMVKGKLMRSEAGSATRSADLASGAPELQAARSQLGNPFRLQSKAYNVLEAHDERSLSLDKIYTKICKQVAMLHQVRRAAQLSGRTRGRNNRDSPVKGGRIFRLVEK